MKNFIMPSILFYTSFVSLFFVSLPGYSQTSHFIKTNNGFIENLKDTNNGKASYTNQDFQGNNNNSIFEKGLHYTVKIKTTITHGFFGEQKGTYNGAGTLIDQEEGWIVTNAHVVGRSPSNISLSFIKNQDIPAEKIYVDAYMDIAVLKIDPNSIPKESNAAVYNCSDKPKQGIQIGTIGHPRGLSWSVTSGIISGKQNLDMEYLQIDAPLNPGNSGGPLINLNNGEIIGMNTAVIMGSQNTNFAVSSQYICTIINLLKKDIDPSPIKLSWNFYKNKQDESKLKIANVYENSFVDFSFGDEIIKVNDQPAPENLTKFIDMLRGKDYYDFLVKREGKEVNLKGKIIKENNEKYKKGISFSGILVGDVSDNFINDLKIDGVLIHLVDKGSTSENVGLQTNDFITHINNKKINNIDDLAKAIQNQTRALITIKRIGGTSSTASPFSYFEYNMNIVDIKNIK